MKNFNEIISSSKVRLTAGIIGAFILAFLIFHAGVVVGSHRGGFDRHPGFQPPFFPGGLELPHGFISSTHGAVGAITALTLPTFTMETRAGTSETIFVSTSTLVQSMSMTGAGTLSVGNQVIVLGEPDSQGRIDATLIRILPLTPPTP